MAPQVEYKQPPPFSGFDSIESSAALPAGFADRCEQLPTQPFCLTLFKVPPAPLPELSGGYPPQANDSAGQPHVAGERDLAAAAV